MSDPTPIFPRVDRTASDAWTCTCDACRKAAAKGKPSGWPGGPAERTPVDGNRHLRIGLAFAALVILAGVTLALILAAGEPGGAGVVASPR